MKCEQIQPDLLDFSKGLLSGPEAREIRAHLKGCLECTALLEEETAFSASLAALPAEEPANDVWALVRTRTKPARLHSLPLISRLAGWPVAVRRGIAAAAAAAVIAFTVYSTAPGPPPPAAKGHVSQAASMKWSDDPLGNQTDAMVKLIDNM